MTGDAEAYKLLSLMLRYPTEASARAIGQYLGYSPTLEDLRQEYQALFGGPLPGTFPPLEAEYDQPHVFGKMQALADLAGFYRAFGLEPASALHRIDHIAVELEFAHVLVARERAALERGDSEKVRLCRSARRAWLSEHLGPWGVRYLTLVAERAGDSTYGRVARVASEFLFEECKAFGIEVEERPPRRNEGQKVAREEGCAASPSEGAP